MQYDTDFYIMIQKYIAYAKLLILSKKSLLTFVLALTTIGSYTYSEIATTPSQTSIFLKSSLILQKVNNKAFSIYYLAPISSLKYKPEKKEVIIVPSEMIMDTGLIKLKILADFLVNTNKSIEYNYAQLLAEIYIEESNCEGVNYDIAFTQMCLETGFLRFDGTVDRHQNNFCGLGVIGNGVKGLSFKDTRHGVRAHIQHLKAYASTNNLSNKIVDKRFNYVKRGSATQISELTGKWATDVQYDTKIRSLLNRLYRPSN